MTGGGVAGEPAGAGLPGGGRTRRGGRALRAVGLVLPGVPALLGGRPWAGGVVVGGWLSLVSLLLWRWERVAGAFGGTLEERVALLALTGGLVVLWLGGTRMGTVEGKRRLERHPLAMAGLVVVGVSFLVAFLAPFLAPHDPLLQPTFQEGVAAARLAPPGPGHLLGTDQYSRDILSRILYGARISLSISLLSVAIGVGLGTLVGGVAGYVGGVVETLLMRTVDVVIAFPRLVLLIAVVAVFRPSITLVVLVLGLTQWPATARIVRAEVLSLRERGFVLAARALGFSDARILFRHVLPNVLAPVIVTATLGVGNTIVLEAGLSFLGLGVQPPTPSWGRMVADGRAYLMDAWWVATFPGLAIVLVVVAFNLLGDGLRDVLDPRQP